MAKNLQLCSQFSSTNRYIQLAISDNDTSNKTANTVHGSDNITPKTWRVAVVAIGELLVS